MKFNFLGRNPSVSVSRDGKAVVVVCQGYVKNRLFSLTGKMTSESQIKWNSKDCSLIPASRSCCEPSIALANYGTAILVYQKTSFSELFRCYYLEIKWGTETAIENKGWNPSVDINDGNNPAVIVGYISSNRECYGQKGIVDHHSKEITAGKQVLISSQNISHLSISINAYQCMAVIYYPNVDIKKAVPKIYITVGEVNHDGTITLCEAAIGKWILVGILQST